MSLVPSLLTAIVRADGDALVLHVGEKPYVVTAAGTVGLSTTLLNLEAMSGMLTQLLPADALGTLSEVGAVEHQLQPPSTMRDAFTVVAARGGDDIWIEIRRKRAVISKVPEVAKVPEVPRVQVPKVQEPEVPAGGEGARDTGNVVPMVRTVRIEVPPKAPPPQAGGVERLLGIAAARGASALYLTSQSRPFLRIDGEMRAIEGEPLLTSADVQAAVIELMPEATREAHGRGEPTEWVSEFDDIGRVRCTIFKDHRGAGVLFHLISTRPMSAEQLGLAREIQALATEPEGLVLVAGPRGGGKSTLLASLVDLINRKHGGSIVTIERQIRLVHENRLALVSQREVRGAGADAGVVVSAALRENPDVLVIEDLATPEVIQLALEAAGSGRLVFFSVTAGSTVSALQRLVDLFPPEKKKPAQNALAERLRGAVSQVLLRKAGGGRLAARELLLTTSAVAGLIAEGQFAQLSVAMDSGRKLGMVSLNDVLLALVRSGAVDVREAYRKADNRPALLALLKREGVDTSLLEKLA